MLGSAKTNLPLLTLTSWVKGTSSFGRTSQKNHPVEQDQVHLASRTHFVDLVIHDICSQKIIPYFADLVIHNICSQKIMPYFFWQIIDINKKFCTVSINFLLQFFKSFSFLGENFFGENFLAKNFWVKIFWWKIFWMKIFCGGENFWVKFCLMKIF